MLNAECHNEAKNKFRHVCEQYDGQEQKNYHHDAAGAVIFEGSLVGVSAVLAGTKWERRSAHGVSGRGTNGHISA
jgi:hypothetical protein